MESARKLITYSVPVIYDGELLKSIRFCVSNSTCNKNNGLMWQIRFRGRKFGYELLSGVKWKPSSKGLLSSNPIHESRACLEISFVEVFFPKMYLIEADSVNLWSRASFRSRPLAAIWSLNRPRHECLSLVGVAHCQVEDFPRADHPPRGVLPNVLCLSRNLKNQETWATYGCRAMK